MSNSSVDHDDFHSKTAAFMSWLQRRPGVTINPKIRVADLRHIGAGRGVVAVEDIGDEEELFRINPMSLLSVENSFLSVAHPELYHQLDSWNSLILTLIYEDGQGDASDWWPYLNILPTHFDTLMYWSTSELAELRGSAVLGKIGKDNAEQSFVETILPIVHKNFHLFGAHAVVFRDANAARSLKDLAHRMATLIMAYAFDLEDEPSTEEDDDDDERDTEDQSDISQQENKSDKVMIPLADLLNANGDLNNAHLLQSQSSMTMIALRPIKQGEQILNDFGELPRSDLLRRYGYVTDQYKKWDVVEIDLESLSNATTEYKKFDNQQTELRLQVAAKWDVLQDGFDLCRSMRADRFDFDNDFLLTATALLLNVADYERAVSTPHVPDQPPAHLRMPLYEVLKSIIAKRHKAYHTTIAQDISLLANPKTVGRHRMAIEVRLGEKEILAMAAQEIDKQLAKLLTSQNRANDDGSGKKRKL